MELTLRPMTQAEQAYCYSQSQQISMQTGLIGHLRADFGSNGTGFYSTFFDFRDSLKSDDFRAEFDLDYTPNHAVEAPLTLGISTSLGFGGHNGCLAFRKLNA